MFNFLWICIVGAVIGLIAGAITSRDIPLGCIGNILAGIIGSWLGDWIFGLFGLSNFGPQLAGMNLIPALLGAILFVVIFSAIFRWKKK